MRPRLKSLTLSGLRSFSGDKNSVTFPDTGLVLLQGVNKDTGGSSGSGKSSVNLGIAYALDYCPYPSTTLASWNGQNALKVDLTLETDAGELRIRRAGSQQLWVAGEQVKGGAAAVKERLKTVLGVDPDILSLLTYRGQRKPGLFLSQTDAEKKTILTQLLKLDRFEKAVEDGQARLKVLEQRAQETSMKARSTAEALDSLPIPEIDGLPDRIKEMEHSLEQNNSDLERLRQIITKKETEAKSRAQDIFDSFRDSIQGAELSRDSIQRVSVDFDDTETVRLQGIIEEANRRIRSLGEADRLRRAELEARTKEIQDRLASHRKIAQQKPLLLKESARLLSELAKLQENVCPTCERSWLQAKAKKEELSAYLELNAQKLAECELANEAAEQAQIELNGMLVWEPDPRIAKLQDACSKAQGQLQGETSRMKAAEQTADANYQRARAEAQAAIAEIKTKQQQAYTEARHSQEADVAKARQIADSKNVTVTALASELKQLRYQLEIGLKTAAQRKALEDTVQKLKAEEAAAQTVFNEERDLLAAIGREGFLGSIFDEVLAEISEETNQILGSVANTRHCTLEFRSESTTQKGTVKKSITPILQIGGNEAALEAGASGGMFSAIELAVDLALGEVVARREGVAPGWLILDESFSGLDSVSMESCMEILAKYARDRLVLVVDHATEFKSLFTKFITVEYESGVSTFAT